MLVGGISGLFPLEKINVRWKDYYINANGEVLSTKGNPTRTVVKRLCGSRTPSGLYYTLKNSTERADNLLRKAKAHKDFAKETMTHLEAIQMAYHGKVLEAPAPTDRNHAATVAEGLKARGYIIGRVVGEAIVFGSKPKIHTTLASVKAEMERLANKSPGTQLAYFQAQGAVRAASLVWE